MLLVSFSFRRKKVCNIISECMSKELEGKEFDEGDCKGWSTAIADAVKARIHADCSFPRYKVVVQTFIGQQRLQDVRITSRCLWDNDHDNHASAVFNSVRGIRIAVNATRPTNCIFGCSNISGPRASSSASTPTSFQPFMGLVQCERDSEQQSTCFLSISYFLSFCRHMYVRSGGNNGKRQQRCALQFISRGPVTSASGLQLLGLALFFICRSCHLFTTRFLSDLCCCAWHTLVSTSAVFLAIAQCRALPTT